MLADFFHTIASFLLKHSWTLCMAWTASLLVIYGNKLVKISKEVVKSWPFLLRLLFFIFVCGLGFGMLTVFTANFLNSQINSLNDIQIVAVVLLAFLLLGLLAEKNKVI